MLELKKKSDDLDRREADLKVRWADCSAWSKRLGDMEANLNAVAMEQAFVAKENEDQRGAIIKELSFAKNKVVEARAKEKEAVLMWEAFSAEKGNMEGRIRGLENKVVKLEAQVAEWQAKYDKERAKRSEASQLLREALTG